MTDPSPPPGEASKHVASPQPAPDSAAAKNAALGIRLFCLYAVFYLAFVLVNAFAADWSDWELIDGLNLAVVWGFALIFFAFVLAVVYGLQCRKTESLTQGNGSEEVRS